MQKTEKINFSNWNWLFTRALQTDWLRELYHLSGEYSQIFSQLSMMWDWQTKFISFCKYKESSQKSCFSFNVLTDGHFTIASKKKQFTWFLLTGAPDLGGSGFTKLGKFTTFTTTLDPFPLLTFTNKYILNENKIILSSKSRESTNEKFLDNI